MPGVRFGMPGGPTSPPVIRAGLLANTQTIYSGDFMALSLNASITSSSVPVLRPLLAADKTAHYRLAGIAAPGAPGTFSSATTGGTIVDGHQYYYKAFWYTIYGTTAVGTASAQQTTATSANTNANTLQAPATPPAGAIGWGLAATLPGAIATSTYYIVGSSPGNVSAPIVQYADAVNTLPLAPTANSSGQIAGTVGAGDTDVVTNSTGFATGTPLAGGIATGASPIYPLAGIPGSLPADPNTGRSRFDYITASRNNVFRMVLDATSAAATPALNGTLAGVIITGTNPPRTYTVDTNAVAADQFLEIIQCDESDPLYGSVGGRVFVVVATAFDQFVNGVYYSAQ